MDATWGRQLSTAPLYLKLGPTCCADNAVALAARVCEIHPRVGGCTHTSCEQRRTSPASSVTANECPAGPALHSWRNQRSMHDCCSECDARSRLPSTAPGPGARGCLAGRGGRHMQRQDRGALPQMTAALSMPWAASSAR